MVEEPAEKRLSHFSSSGPVRRVLRGRSCARAGPDDVPETRAARGPVSVDLGGHDDARGRSASGYLTSPTCEERNTASRPLSVAGPMRALKCGPFGGSVLSRRRRLGCRRFSPARRTSRGFGPFGDSFARRKTADRPPFPRQGARLFLRPSSEQITILFSFRTQKKRGRRSAAPPHIVCREPYLRCAPPRALEGKLGARSGGRSSGRAKNKLYTCTPDRESEF